MKKEIEILIPFDTIEKRFSDGTVFIKKLKFTAYKQELGYEAENDLLISGTLKEKDSNYKLQKAIDNMIKTRSKIYDIARNNGFNYFITMTYNKEKVDRYSFQECSAKIRKFMNNFAVRNKETCPNFKYLIVHEKHKDGAFHYHGLIYLESKDTLTFHKKIKGGNIYNWEKWKNGFSTVSEIKNLEATRKYILKYVLKDIDIDYVKGQRRYYCSQNCERPVKQSYMLENDIDTNVYKQVYESDISIGYETTQENILKCLFDKKINFVQ